MITEENREMLRAFSLSFALETIRVGRASGLGTAGNHTKQEVAGAPWKIIVQYFRDPDMVTIHGEPILEESETKLQQVGGMLFQLAEEDEFSFNFPATWLVAAAVAAGLTEETTHDRD